jgi:hypothetical protein
MPQREVKMSGELNHDRRRFLRNATVAFAAAELATIGSAGEVRAYRLYQLIRQKNQVWKAGLLRSSSSIRAFRPFRSRLARELECFRIQKILSRR